MALQVLMKANQQQRALSRLEMAARDVIPYLLCTPSGLHKVATLETPGILMLMFPEKNQDARTQARLAALLHYANREHATLIKTCYSSNEPEPELERRADAAAAASATTDPSKNPTFVAMTRMLEEMKKQN